MADSAEFMYETVDKEGNPITIFSREGKRYDDATFTKVLTNYDSGKQTPGFDVMPKGMLGDIRAGYESVNVPVQEQAQRVSQIPQPAPQVSPLTNPGLSLAARVLNPLLSAVKTVTPQAAESVNTPEKAATQAAVMATGPLMKGVTTAAGNVDKLALLGNALKTGVAGLAGHEAGRQVTAQPFSTGKAAAEFAVMAGSGLASSVIGHWITKYVNPVDQESVAKAVLDKITEKSPALANNPAVLDIGLSSSQKLTDVTQQMSKSLLGTVDDFAKSATSKLARIEPFTTGEQNTLRAHMRTVANAHAEQMDNIGNDKLFAEGADKVMSAMKKTVDYIQTIYPSFPNPKASARLDSALGDIMTQFQNNQEGAWVLHYLKKADSGNGLDLMRFAQEIKGVYKENPGSALEAVGKILRPGGNLTDLPAPGSKVKGYDMTSQLLNALRYIPGFRGMPRVPYQGPSVPWQAPTPALNSLSQSAVQGVTGGAAQQGLDTAERGNEAVRSFLNKGKK